MHRFRLLQTTRTFVFLGVVLVLSCMAFAQNYVAPSHPVVGQPNTVTANAPVPRPGTQPCTVTLFQNFDFADFNPKPFNYTPPAGCPGPWAAIVFEADWSVDPGVQFDRTANIWLGGANIFFGTTAEPSASFTRTWHTESNLTEMTPLFTVAQQGQVDTWQPGQQPVHQPLSRQRVSSVLPAGPGTESAGGRQCSSTDVGRTDRWHGNVEYADRPVGRNIHDADQC